MVQIGDIGKRILKEYQIDVNNVCPMDFPVYQRTIDEANEIRSRLAKDLLKNIPDCLK